MKVVRFSEGLGWYIYESETKTIVASQFESREEAESEV